MAEDDLTPATAGPDRLRLGDVELRPREGLVLRDGTSSSVEPRIMELLIFLIERRGSVVTKEEIFERVWGGEFVTESVIFRAMSVLRRSLGDDAKAPRFIRTLPRRGYVLLAPIYELPVESPASPRHEVAGRFTEPKRRRAWWLRRAGRWAVGLALAALVGLGTHFAGRWFDAATADLDRAGIDRTPAARSAPAGKPELGLDDIADLQRFVDGAGHGPGGESTVGTWSRRLPELVDLVDPWRPSSADRARAAATRRWVTQARDELADQPLPLAEALLWLGGLQRRLGWLDEARRQLEEAERLLDRTSAPAALHAAVALELGWLAVDEADPPRARNALESAVALAEEADAATQFEAHLALGRLHLDRGEIELASASWEAAGAALGPDPEPRRRARWLHARGELELCRYDLDAARRWLLDARSWQDEALGPHHPELALTELTYARVESWRGDLEAAERSLRRAGETLGLALGEAHPATLEARSSLASLLSRMGRFEESLVLKRETLRAARARLPSDHPDLAILGLNIAATQTFRGQFEDAEQGVRSAIGELRRALGDDHPKTRVARSDRAFLDLFRGEYVAAAAGFESALRRHEPRSCDLRRHTLLLYRAESLTLAADWPAVDEALGRLDESLRGLQRDCDTLATRTIDAYAALTALLRGDALAARAHDAAAQRSWLEAVGSRRVEALLRQDVKRQHIHAVALMRLGRSDEAAPLVRRLRGNGWAHPSFLALEALGGES